MNETALLGWCLPVFYKVRLCHSTSVDCHIATYTIHTAIIGQFAQKTYISSYL